MLDIKKKYDVIILGSGPSGCASAIKCAKNGLKTLCIDTFIPNQSSLLKPGRYRHPPCFESILLLESAKLFNKVTKDLSSHGISVENISLNFETTIKRKNLILNKINQNITNRLIECDIDFITAHAKLLGSNKVEIESLPHPKQIISDYIILATESIPVTVPSVNIDNTHIFDFNTACNLTSLPRRIAILGAGVHGLELGCIWNKFGTATTLLDAQENFLGLTDHQISCAAYKTFSDQGLDIQLGARVLSTSIVNNKVLIEYQDQDGIHGIRVDKLFVASGRKPNSQHLCTPEANLLLDENGYIYIDDKYRTNLPNVFAVGDLTLLGPMLPHKGIVEGEYVANHIAGIKDGAINYKLIPNVIYTDPEIAWVGQTEQALKAKGAAIKTGFFPQFFKYVGINDNHNDDELVKVIVNAKDDTILGIHTISEHASELIAEAVLAMEFSANKDDLSKIIQPYPSFASALREASLVIND